MNTDITVFSQKSLPEHPLPGNQAFWEALFPSRFQLSGSISVCSVTGDFDPWYTRDELDRAPTSGQDLYFQCATHDPAIAKQASMAKKEVQRQPWNSVYKGCAESAKELCFVWADIDLAESEKSNRKNYPPRAIALQVLQAMEILPSIIVSSGNGLHAYWLFDTPQQAQHCQTLLANWGVFLQTQMVNQETGEQYDLDPVYDLARCLRVPGTINSKGGREVEILACLPERRYAISTIEAAGNKAVASLAAMPGQAKIPVNIDNFVIDPECKTPKCLSKLRKSAKFRDTWEHSREDLANDQSTYDMAIGAYAARQGCSNQEIVDLLVVNRLAYGINIEKVEREDYYRRTLEKIRQGIAIEAQRQATRFDPYVYVLSIKRFVDLTTLQYLDKEQFCDVHQSQLRGREAVQQFLERHDTQKVAGETYLPGEGRFVEEGGLLKLNLWEPPLLRPQEGDITILINHIRYLFSNDLDAGEYFLDWVAHLVQHPAVKLKTTPLLIGAQGVGKDAIGLAIRQVLGINNTVEIENEELKSQYNDWMRNTSLVVIGELMTRGRLEVMNRLKPLITQPTFRLERKYMSTVTMPNRANFLLFSNYSDAARLEEEDRRYFVHIADVKPQPAEYYDKLFRFIDSEDGTAAFAHYLLHRDISHFNPHAKAPMTASKRQVIEESRSPLEVKFYTLFEDKEPPFDKDLVTVEKVMSALDPGFHRRFGKELNIKSVGALLRKIGGKELGQKRLGKDGSLRPRLWVIRRHEMWQQAGKEAIEKHLEIDAKANVPYSIVRS